MAKKKATLNPLPIIAGIAIGGFMLFQGKKVKAGTLPKDLRTSKAPQTGANIITSHDAVYDYKYINGVWYTRRKGSGLWINMKKALSPESYALSVKRLSRYL